MGLAGDQRGADRNSLEIVDDARRRRAEMGDGERARVDGVEEGSDVDRRKVDYEIVERIAFDRSRRFPEHGGSGEHPQRIESHLRTVAVGVSHPKWLEDTVIVFGGR